MGSVMDGCRDEPEMVPAYELRCLQNALTTANEARLRAESERDALKAENERLFGAGQSILKSKARAAADHRRYFEKSQLRMHELKAEVDHLTAPATDEDVEQAAYRWFCQSHDPEDWNDNWKADYVADLRAAIEALRG